MAAVAQGAGRADSTIAAYATDIWEFSSWLQRQTPRGQALAQLRPGLLQEYQSHLGERRLATATICRKLDALSSFFRYLVRAEAIDRNPLDVVPRARPKNRRYEWMPEDEARRVLTALEDRLERTVFLTLYRTGLRRGELIRLRLDDVDLGPGTITVSAQKTDTVRYVPISREVERCLADYLERRPACEHDEFFITRSQGVPLYGTLLQRWFHRWMATAGLEGKGYTIHTLRHSAATNWLRGGLHVAEVQRLMGHTSLETTARYLHWDDDEIRRKVARMEAGASEPDRDVLGDRARTAANESDAQQRIVHRLAEAAEAGDSGMVQALTKALEAMAATPVGV